MSIPYIKCCTLRHRHAPLCVVQKIQLHKKQACYCKVNRKQYFSTSLPVTDQKGKGRKRSHFGFIY